MQNEMTRRAALTGIALAGATGALPVAAAAMLHPEPDTAKPEDPTEATDDWQDGYDVALDQVAEAWINRWQALGGNFGMSYNADGTARGLMRGAPMSYVWTPPTIEAALEHSPTLRPHELILDRDDFDGARKMLDSLLTLISGLSDAVYERAGMMVLAGAYKAQRPDIAAFLAARRKEG